MKYCADCGGPKIKHIRTWGDGLFSACAKNLPRGHTIQTLERWLGEIIHPILVKLRVLKKISIAADDPIPMRTACLVKEANAKNIPIFGFRGPFGYTNYFQIKLNEKLWHFEGLPVAEFANTTHASNIDDKYYVKQKLKKHDLPAPIGKSFWFFEQKSAIAYGEKIGFPLVVKPRSGSYSRHITTHIETRVQLKRAIQSAIEYAPNFVVEQYYDASKVYRATVVDFECVAILERIPASVVGDGQHTINELCELKNSDPARGYAHEENCTLFKIVIDKTTQKLLVEQYMTFDTIPEKDRWIQLQRDPFIRLGADSRDATATIHPDNKKLFEDIACLFDVRVVGIDFICKDIARSWHDQECAALELNSLPCIEIHHFPTYGEPRNVAGAILDLATKYYRL